MKILVIGESCADVYQYGDANRLCPEAPVPIFLKGTDKKVSPGMAMNVYRNIVSLVGADCVDIITNKNWKRITKTRFVDIRTNSIILRLDENDSVKLCKDINEIDYDKYDLIVISDYDKGFLPERSIEAISRNHDNVFLDTKKILGGWADRVKYIKINEFEFERTKYRIGVNLRDKMIITLGPRGAEHQKEVFDVVPVEIKDTSGAGDTFIAALVASYAKNKDIKLAINLANQCATEVVQRKGVSVI